MLWRRREVIWIIWGIILHYTEVGKTMASEAAESVSEGAAFAITKWRSVSIAGPEDITIDHVVRRTCISSEDRWRKNGSAPVCGGIFALNLTGQSAHKIDGTIVSARIRGQNVSFFVADETDLIQKEHFNGKFYESEELKIISEFFPSGGIFVDVGANVGNHTVFVGRFLSPLKVIVIEPNPATFEILKANIALNRLDSRVDASYLGIGLSNTSARAVAITPAGNLGGTRLHFSEEQSGLRVVPGDALLSGHRIDFLKIDVEGMEIEVLEGLKRTIAEQRPRIFIEVDNSNVGKFFEWTTINNYYIAASSSRRPVWSALPTSTPGYENFMLIPEVRH